jgi:adenylate cyclase
MTSEGFTRKLTAVLSADVKGYSRLMGEDEAATVRTITDYREVMSELIQGHRGRVVDSPGDNILAEFASVVDAVRCAVEIQQTLKARNDELPESRRMEFRIGINLGDVIEQEGRLYGDGVNIAARIEALADPGGICVSGTVHEHVSNKLDLSFEHRGEHAVKNIAQLVSVYRIAMDPASLAKARPRPVGRWRWQWAALAVAALLVVGVAGFAIWKFALRPTSPPAEEISEQTAALDLPSKPSVAVLPFDNMSGDAEQEYFSDGITEDLITDLSKVSGLFVIARNSTFLYKGKAVNVEDVGRELGVRYVLEGSVRKVEDTVRITAQLIDATTGGHVWAERYDRDLQDIFALQDEVVARIVAALAVTLTDEEQELLAQDATDNLEAYDYERRGWWYKGKLTKEDNEQARLMFERAIELDPQFASAYAGRGFTYYEEWSHQWSQDPGTLDRAYDMATEAIALDDSHAGAHALLGWVYLWRKQHDLAIALMEQAIALNPNHADHYNDLAQVLVFAGKPQEAVELTQKAMRLNPHYPVQYPFTLGFAYFFLEQYVDATTALEEALTINPFYFPSHLVLAGVSVETGQEEKARYHMAEAGKINPQLSLEGYGERLPFKDPAVIRWFLDALGGAAPE